MQNRFTIYLGKGHGDLNLPPAVQPLYISAVRVLLVEEVSRSNIEQRTNANSRFLLYTYAVMNCLKTCTT